MFKNPHYERKQFNEENTDIGSAFSFKTLQEVKDQVLDELIAKYGADARFDYNNDYYSGISFSLATAYRQENDAEYAARIKREEFEYQRQLRHAECEVNRAKKEGNL